ncbi:MAG TPA: pyrroloquinoline quinone precursor peptide PqqA [Bradyrhizobium sp.]
MRRSAAGEAGNPCIKRKRQLVVMGAIEQYGPVAWRRFNEEKIPMAWTTPTLVEICIGLEINGYLPAEF